MKKLKLFIVGIVLFCNFTTQAMEKNFSNVNYMSFVEKLLEQPTFESEDGSFKKLLLFEKKDYKNINEVILFFKTIIMKMGLTNTIKIEKYKKYPNLTDNPNILVIYSAENNQCEKGISITFSKEEDLPCLNNIKKARNKIMEKPDDFN